jgi:hypothetical protein
VGVAQAVSWAKQHVDGHAAGPLDHGRLSFVGWGPAVARRGRRADRAGGMASALRPRHAVADRVLRPAFEVGRAELRSVLATVVGKRGKLRMQKVEGVEALVDQLGTFTGAKPPNPSDFEAEPRFDLANALANAVSWSESGWPRIEEPPPRLPIDTRAPTFNEAMAMARR